jgi:tetratricopeptide (TPR) repeat protein
MEMARECFEISLDLARSPNPYEAKKQFRRALEIRADHVECLKRMARLNKLEESYEGAIECLQNALKYEPDDAGMWLELGDLFESLGHGEKSKECWAKAIEVEPDGDAADYAREKLDGLQFEEEESRESGPRK